MLDWSDHHLAILNMSPLKDGFLLLRGAIKIAAFLEQGYRFCRAFLFDVEIWGGPVDVQRFTNVITNTWKFIAMIFVGLQLFVFGNPATKAFIGDTGRICQV